MKMFYWLKKDTDKFDGVAADKKYRASYTKEEIEVDDEIISLTHIISNYKVKLQLANRDIVELHEKIHEIRAAKGLDVIDILINDFMKPRSMTRKQLLEATGYGPTRISLIMTRKESITNRLAGKLAEVFGTSVNFWLR